ncbi:MAG: YfiR family protein [Rhizomicrobium sp.]
MGLAKLRIGISAALAALFCACAATDAAADGSIEYAVKGAYLYKMLPFVDWPQTVFPAPASPITICIVGRDPFGGALDKAVADQHIGAHPIVVHRNVAPGDTTCQAAFIGLDSDNGEVEALQAFNGRPVLTVTDSSAPMPGIVSFVIEQNHVRFDIDDAKAAQDGLSISSKLLDLARKVKPRKAAP